MFVNAIGGRQLDCVVCNTQRLILHANQAAWIKLDLHVCVYVESYMNVHFRDVTSLIVIISQLGPQSNSGFLEWG